MTENRQSRTASRAARRKQKKKQKKSIWKKILIALAIVFLATAIGTTAVFGYWIATAPELDESKLADPFSSSLLDKDGKEFAVLGTDNRKKIEYEDLPQVLIDAVTATEDARFFKHHGIDFRRLFGAILANITDGFGSQGASTITHQVVEKSFLSPEKKIKLKVQEQWLALKLERKYSKEEILEMYLNKIFYGANSYGVAQAAETYFGKSDLHDLTLAEAAILAGLPQRPTAYNPFENPDATKKRMHTVLDLMVRHGKITEEEAEEAKQVDIPSLLVEKRPESNPYDAFIQQVQQEIEEKLDGANIFTDGLTIHTTLDTSIQDYVEFLLKDSEENPIPYPDDEMQAGMVVLDTKTGAIKAIGGSRNNENIGGFNYAIHGGSQPGSVAKPIIAYGPAIEYNKISTYHQINDDKPYEIAGTDKAIRNWNRQYQGWVSARYALQWSLNVPAVKVFDEAGWANAQQFAENLGIEFANDEIALTDPIGGSQTEVTPLQIAGAYRAFGNEGIYNEPYAVTKVVFQDGREVDLTPDAEVVMADYTAYMITDMLKTVVREGTGTAANISGLPVAGKTGTTNLEHKEGSPDAWFAGYTTNFTIAAWAGGYTDENGNRDVIPQGGTQVPLHLFRHTMQEISQGLETPDFERPSSVVEVKVEKGSNPPRLPSEFTPASEIVTELFVKGTEPTEVSEKFDELDPVTGLTATYDEETNSIHVEWKYDEEADVSFEVSAALEGSEMQVLSLTEDTAMTISEVEPGEYQIQVVVVSNEDEEIRSEPATVKVTVAEEEENIPPVQNLNAVYDENRGIIDVTWSYQGPPAAFEVSVNGQVHSNLVQGNGIEISGAVPGTTYQIIVTPIGQQGANEGVRGESASFTIKIPGETSPPPEEEEEIPEQPADGENGEDEQPQDEDNVEE